MGKQNGDVLLSKNGNSGYSQLAMQQAERQRKRKMITDMIKRKEIKNG